MQKKIDTRHSHNSSFDFTGPIDQWPREIQAVFARFSVEVAADEVFWMRDDSKLLYVNDSACRRLGYSREELLLMYVWDWDPLFSKELWYDLLRDIGEKKTLFFETQHRTKSGDIFPVEISSHVFPYEGKNYLFAFVTDISERKKTEDELENHRNHLEILVQKRTKELENTLVELKATQAELLHSQKLQAIGQLAAGIAHEINTPSQYVGNNLSFIHDGFTDLLQAMESCRALLADSQKELSVQDFRNKLEHIIEISDLDFLTEEVPQALAACEDGIGRITTIVSAMKNFAHASGDAPELVQVKSLIESTVEISRSEWKLIADLETEFDPEFETVLGFRDELGQALLNLIVNASHAIEDSNNKEGQKGLIRIVTRCDGDWGEIKVEDNGCGISLSLQQKIFEPFYTTKEVGRGSGQGLAISYNIVTDKHHGTIRVLSEPGEGSTFIMRLPLLEQRANH